MDEKEIHPYYRGGAVPPALPKKKKPIMSEAEFILEYALKRAGVIDGVPESHKIVNTARKIYKMAREKGGV